MGVKGQGTVGWLAALLPSCYEDHYISNTTIMHKMRYLMLKDRCTAKVMTQVSVVGGAVHSVLQLLYLPAVVQAAVRE